MQEEGAEGEERMGALREQYSKKLQQEQAQREAEVQLDSILRAILDDESKARLANIKLVNSELYLRAAQTLIYLYRARRLEGKISDLQLKEILAKLSTRKEINIRRK